MPGTLRCVEAALALGAQGADLLRLRALQATAAFWMGDLAKLFETGPGVLAELRAGSRQWCWLASGLYMGHGLSGGRSRQRHRADACCAPVRSRGTGALPGGARLRDAMSNQAGPASSPPRTWRGSSSSVPRSPPEASLERAWSSSANRAMSRSIFEARPWQAYVWLEQACRGFFEVGLERHRRGAGPEGPGAGGAGGQGRRRGPAAACLALAQRLRLLRAL